MCIGWYRVYHFLGPYGYGRSQKLRKTSVFNQTNDVVTSNKGISFLTLMDYNYSVMAQEELFQMICC